jgi:hypothetical protein
MRRFYLARVQGRIVRVTSEGMTYAREVKKVIDRVDKWALVFARDLPEAKDKFERGDVIWLS